jgi:hypothetical protein
MKEIQKIELRPEKPRIAQVCSTLSRALERGEVVALSQRTSVERLVGKEGPEGSGVLPAGEGASFPG